MKKSLLLILSLPLLLTSCDLSTGSGSSKQTSETTTDTTSQTEEKTDTGTEGSGTETTGGETTGGETTGGGTTEGGKTTGGGTTGGEETTGGGTTGGETQTKTLTVAKDTTELGLAGNSSPTTVNINSDVSLNFELGDNKYNNKPKYIDGESIRLYGGNKLTIQNSKGVITKIEFSCKSDKKENVFSADVGNYSNDNQTWTGSNSKIVLSVGGTSGHIKLYSLEVTYTTTGGGSTGGEETTGGGTTGGETTGGGDSGQSGNGNTSSEWTTKWTGIQYDIAYSLFKGNLPCLKAFNGYAVGCVGGSTKMYFNPYVKGWSKESQTYYDNALRDMGYAKIDEDTDENGVLWFYYEKGTYEVKTSHYRGDDGEYYFDVYAYNDYEAPFKLDYTPTVELTTDVYPIKSSYKQFSKTINGITFACSWCTENSGYIQLAKQSTMEITSSTTLSKLDIVFNYGKSCCLVYAGSSNSNAKIVYNNGNHWDLPSGTKYVRLLAVDPEEIVQIDCLSIK